MPFSRPSVGGVAYDAVGTVQVEARTLAFHSSVGDI